MSTSRTRKSLGTRPVHPQVHVRVHAALSGAATSHGDSDVCKQRSTRTPRHAPLAIGLPPAACRLCCQCAQRTLPPSCACLALACGVRCPSQAITASAGTAASGARPRSSSRAAWSASSRRLPPWPLCASNRSRSRRWLPHLLLWSRLPAEPASQMPRAAATTLANGVTCRRRGRRQGTASCTFSRSPPEPAPFLGM